MLIGGAEDKLKTRRILSRFVKLAGGADARIVVVSTASMLGEVTTETYKAIFSELGVAQVTGMRPQSRREAEDPQVAATLVEATGVFLTGGNQLRLTSIVAGTRLDSGLASRPRPRRRDRRHVRRCERAGRSHARVR